MSNNSILPHYNNMGFYDNLLQSFHDHADWLMPVYILLVIYFVKTMFWPKKEGFNPTQTMLMTDSDQFGLSPRERLAAGQAVGAQPGSLGWQVLNSADYNCASRTPVTDDAWAWQMGVVSSPVEGMKPNTDNDFSKIMAGVSN